MDPNQSKSKSEAENRAKKYKTKYLELQERHEELEERCKELEKSTEHHIPKRGRDDRPTVIFYSSVLTGSLEVRKANQYVYWPLLDKAKKEGASLTKVGEYAHLYQTRDGGGGKLDECNYDAFLAMMAHMNNATFDAHLQYVPVKLSDNEGDWGKGAFIGGQRNVLEFYMDRDDAVGRSSGSRGQVFKSEAQYMGKRHLFIMGPISPEAERLIMKSIEEHGSDLVIHYQGEAKKSTGDDVSDMAGMTGRGNLFAVSFNWAGGMANSRVVRDAFGRSNCYTVGVKADAPRRSIRELAKEALSINDEQVDKMITNPRNNSKDSDIEKELPQIFADMNRQIHDTMYIKSSGGAASLIRFLNFGETIVVQDMYDRDNHSSVWVIADNSTRVHLCLTGRECHTVEHADSSKNVIMRGDRTLSIDAGKPSPFFMLVDFTPAGRTGAVDYWPRFKDASLVHKLDGQRTLDENRYMAKGFMDILSDVPSVSKIRMVGRKWNERDHSSIARCGDHVAPFNELLFAQGMYYVVATLRRDRSVIKRTWKELMGVMGSS